MEDRWDHPCLGYFNGGKRRYVFGLEIRVFWQARGHRRNLDFFVKQIETTRILSMQKGCLKSDETAQMLVFPLFCSYCKYFES